MKNHKKKQQTNKREEKGMKIGGGGKTGEKLLLSFRFAGEYKFSLF